MARRTLLRLRQRVELQRAPQTLLRAAHAKGGDLLRPAAGGDGLESHMLLRPVVVHENTEPQMLPDTYNPKRAERTI